MLSRQIGSRLFCPALVVALCSAAGFAQSATQGAKAGSRIVPPGGSSATTADTLPSTSLRLAYAPNTQEATKEKTTVKITETKMAESDYREVSSFFNVREANANVGAGEWEFEAPLAWVTESDGEDDDFSVGASLKYGLTDDLFVEVEVLPMIIGDGGDQGNGEMAVVLFNQFVHEDGGSPAFALWLEARAPTANGSSKSDVELHFNLTKTLATNVRGHLEGFVESANGARGHEDEEARRDFQWGAGPGLDYQFSEATIGVLNYINRSSEEFGNPNQNILQVGLAQELAPGQHLKTAVDVGLDGHDSTPNFGAKIQWSIEF